MGLRSWWTLVLPQEGTDPNAWRSVAKPGRVWQRECLMAQRREPWKETGVRGLLGDTGESRTETSKNCMSADFCVSLA